MATNRDLLKEAIADAKAVKEMAIANAKSALEEAFNPRIKEMLSAKLHEMEEEETNEAYSDMDPKGPTAHGNIEEEEHDTMEEELDLDELLAELGEGEESLNEAEGDEDESEDDESEESEEEEGEPLDLEDMTDEDLKKMIEDVISDMIASGELESGDAEGKEEEMEDEEEMVDIEELLKEIEEEEMYEEGLEEIFGFGKDKKPKRDYKTVINQLLADNKATVEAIAAEKDPAKKKQMADSILKKALKEFQKLRSEDIDPDVIGNMNEFKRELFGDSRSLLQKLAAGSSVVDAREGLERELKEAHIAIESLRSDLNEVNLLNAKLLYTNKMFKAKNLNESQKVKVLTAFDKATTVKETKLVYETLSDGLKPKEALRENLGRASKSIIPSNAKSPIIEDENFARMRHLAFYNPKY
jgi:hypothetical protein